MSEPNANHAVLIQHRTLPGRRLDVERVWRKHMLPAVAANPGHEAYFYGFGEEETEILAFQLYTDADAAAHFLATPAYGAYLHEVEPLLEGAPVVRVLDLRWSKQDHLANRTAP